MLPDVTLLEAVDVDIDDQLPLLAGREAVYVTAPHGWKISREGRVRARKGRLEVEFDRDGSIYDHEDIQEDEYVYGVPTSAAEARHLADLYQEAEDILAAYRAGDYLPPSPLPYYRDNKPKDRSIFGAMMSKYLAGMAHELNRPSLFDMLDPHHPYTVKEKFANIWRAMRGEEPLPRRVKAKSGKVRMVLSDEPYTDWEQLDEVTIRKHYP